MPPTLTCLGPGAKHSWVRLQFYDYPVTDGSQWYGSTSAGKIKVYCIQCFDAGFNKLRVHEQNEVNNGTWQQARINNELKT